MTVGATVFAHPVGSEIVRLQFNQWRIYGNSTNSSSGATSIATVDISVDAPFTTYENTGTEYTFYLVVGYNSNTAANEDRYSDGVASATGYGSTAVGSLIEKALDGARSKRNDIITDSWLMGEVNDCLRFISGKLKHWSFLQSFNYVLGQTTRGVFSYTLPTDIEDPNSNKSIIGVRIGSGDNMTYADKAEMESEMENVVQTQVRTEGAVGATTLAIDNSYDFDETGTVTVYVSGTAQDITYTGVTRSATAGVLTGVPASGTGSITATIPVDTNVWQDEEEGQPTLFTVYDGSLYIWSLPDSSYDNLNVYIDYFTSRTLVNSAGDTIEGSRYDAVKHWLIAKIRAQSNAKGKMDGGDPDWQLFNIILGDLIRREHSGQKHPFSPKVNKISYD